MKMHPLILLSSLLITGSPGEPGFAPEPIILKGERGLPGPPGIAGSRGPTGPSGLQGLPG